MRYLICTFLVLCMFTSVFSATTTIIPKKDQKIVYFTVNDFGHEYKKLYLVGQWNDNGKKDGTYSDFIELNDEGKVTDRAKNDHYFDFSIALQKDKTYFVLLFPDKNKMTPDAALSVLEYTITKEDKTQTFEIIPYKKADFKIIVNLEDRKIPELFFYSNWDKDFITKDKISDKRYKFYDDGTNGDAKANDKIFSYMFFGYSIKNKPVYKIKIFDGNTPEESSLTAIREIDQSHISKGILSLSAVDQAKVKFIFDDSREKKFDTMFALGSWDKAGNYDTKYSEDFIIMNKDTNNMFSLERNLSVSPERYTILFFQDDTSKIPSDAIDIKYFEVNNSDTKEIVSVFPKFTDETVTSTPQSQGTLQYVTIICLIFIIIAVILTYSFSQGKFMKNSSEFKFLFKESSKFPLVSISGKNNNVNNDIALNIAYEYIKNYSYSAALITDNKEILKENFDSKFIDSKKFSEYFYVENDLEFEEEKLNEIIDKVEDVDIIIIVTDKKIDSKIVDILKKMYDEFSLPMYIINSENSVKDDKLLKCFKLNLSETNEYENIEISSIDNKNNILRNKKTGIIRKKF